MLTSPDDLPATESIADPHASQAQPDLADDVPECLKCMTVAPVITMLQSRARAIRQRLPQAVHVSDGQSLAHSARDMTNPDRARPIKVPNSTPRPLMVTVRPHPSQEVTRMSGVLLMPTLTNGCVIDSNSTSTQVA